jgi:hypothetical protein
MSCAYLDRAREVNVKMSYPLLDLFLTMMWFFLWILWIFLLFRIITDIFASHDLSGWGKVGWLILVLILPFIGVFAYLVARGDHMADWHARGSQAREDAFRTYAERGSGSADELTK